MGTMAAAAATNGIEEALPCRTRPRPSSSHSVVDAETPQMEAIHAEFLDNYHREAHQPDLEDEEYNDGNSVSESGGLSDPNSRLSETPSTVTQELRASLDEGASSSQRSKNLEKDSAVKRTESFDRRRSEAARFYQAVGEIPPVEGDIPTILEVLDDDDDPDDSESDENSTSGTVQHVMERMDGENFELSFGLEQPEKQKESSARTSPLKEWHKPKQAKQGGLPPFQGRRLSSIFHRLPSGGDLNTDGKEYKGIQSPPEITQHGVSRGNYALLHRKAWLEVSDERHRYGKNLRLYYRKWESLGYPSNDFFDWLDSKGACADMALPELEECPRSELDSDVVLYIKDAEVTKQYALLLDCDESGRICIVDSEDEPVCTGSEGWIFVLRDNVLYGAEKVTNVSDHVRQRFHHSSFFGGKAVAAAGIFITDQDGVLTVVLPHSGHYRPREPDMQRMLFFLYNAGADLRLISVDTQQLNHINRQDPSTFKKKAKKDSLHLSSAATVAHFLSHKARFIGQGIFAQIHKLKHRPVGVGTVREALREVDPVVGPLQDID